MVNVEPYGIAKQICTNLVCDIVHHDNTVGTPVVTGCYSSEPLLTSSVPLQTQELPLKYVLLETFEVT